MTFAIGNTVFATKKSATEFYRRILYAYPENTTVSAPQDHQALLDLLALHRSVTDKIGVGVLSFQVEVNPYRTVGFWLTRIDGSRTDWSFLECLSPSSQEKKVKCACRELIRAQTVAFRRRVFSQVGSLICPITGDTLTNSPETHIDHRITFDTLLEQFLLSEGITFADVGIRQTEDGELFDILEDATLADRWQQYHLLHAQLRCVAKRANIGILRRTR